MPPPIPLSHFTPFWTPTFSPSCELLSSISYHQHLNSGSIFSVVALSSSVRKSFLMFFLSLSLSLSLSCFSLTYSIYLSLLPWWISIYFFSIFFLVFCPTHGFNPTQHDPCGLGWTYVMWCIGLGWIFLNSPWWIGSKNTLNLIHAHPDHTNKSWLS